MGTRNKILTIVNFVFLSVLAFAIVFYNPEDFRLNKKNIEVQNLIYDFYNEITDNEKDGFDYGELERYNYAKKTKRNFCQLNILIWNLKR